MIVIDRLIELHAAGGYQYTSNTLTRSYPDGLDAEVVDFGRLETAWRDARLPSEREHVTPYLRHVQAFSLAQCRSELTPMACAICAGSLTKRATWSSCAAIYEPFALANRP